ncbi:hypothetical protein N1851_000192 [Merluccius polli]|uniref:Uncharacterized protein n=1 Tax=Merluccius polli TaxID=89951 RepID=A0AA47NCG7_MERPO|nr:hypothetical protein N1851_000192 [Merluccius polli]
MRETLSYPFQKESVLIGNALRRERIFRPRLDVLSFPEEYIFQRYRFSSNSIIYLNNIFQPYITNLTHCGRALTSEQTLCIALHNYLLQRYRFTSQSIIYIHNLIRPYICNITNRSHALTSQQILCVALRFFANVFCTMSEMQST